MKPLNFSKILSIACVLYYGHTFADVVHPEDSSIVGGVFDDTVCFNSDGSVTDVSECDVLGFNEGKVVATPGIWKWRGVSPSGIYGCGVAAVNPVTSASCPLSLDTSFAECPFDKFVLVHTTVSEHYWAVKANSNCTAIALPESTGLVPCLKTDAFDPVYGCIEPNPSEITIEGGFIKLDTSTTPPPGVHCLDSSHHGRMVVDSANGILYICTEIGWEPIVTDAP